MGRLAHAAWADYFEPRDYCRRACDQLADIARSRRPDQPEIGPARWHRLIKTEEKRRKGPLLARIFRRLRRTLKR
jgi:hypothetical protein